MKYSLIHIDMEKPNKIIKILITKINRVFLDKQELNRHKKIY